MSVDIEEEEFPISTENSRLSEGWFDADDDVVRRIPSSTIQRQFGGNSDKESAYILLYRKASLPLPDFEIPAYFTEHIQGINKDLEE